MNGWTNRETWLINLWFAPESQEVLDSVRASLEEELDNLRENLPGYLVDLLSINFIMSEVNWDELSRHFEPIESEN